MTRNEKLRETILEIDRLLPGTHEPLRKRELRERKASIASELARLEYREKVASLQGGFGEVI